MKPLFLLLFLLLYATRILPAPAATRDLPDICATSTRTLVYTIQVDPGADPPGSLILQENIPEGWMLVASSWNDTALPPDQTAPLKWIFGLTTPVSAGSLQIELQPAGTVFSTYTWVGSLKYGTTSAVPILGDQHLSACDDDTDNLPDDWERLYWAAIQTTSGDEDFDDDGTDNFTEYRANTNPRLPESCFRILSLDTSSSPWILHAYAGSGTFLTLRVKNSLISNSPSQNLGGQTVAEEGKVFFQISPFDSGFFYLECINP